MLELIRRNNIAEILQRVKGQLPGEQLWRGTDIRDDSRAPLGVGSGPAHQLPVHEFHGAPVWGANEIAIVPKLPRN